MAVLTVGFWFYRWVLLSILVDQHNRRFQSR